MHLSRFTIDGKLMVKYIFNIFDRGASRFQILLNGGLEHHQLWGAPNWSQDLKAIFQNVINASTHTVYYFLY